MEIFKRKKYAPILGLFVLTACASQQPNLTRTYAKQEGVVDQPPVVVIHGALGGRLQETERQHEIWPGSIRRLLFSDYEDLALDIDPVRLVPTKPKAQAVGITDQIAGVDYYRRLLRTLYNAGGYQQGQLGAAVSGFEKRFYVFSYDWRLDAVETARKLDAFIEQIRTDYGKPDLEVDIVAHSLGGLITRYYARYGTTDVLDDNDFPVDQSGAQKIRRAILLGTPNLGSAGALRTLIRGFKLIFGSVPPEVVATFPSTYQVLPHAITDWFVSLDGTPLKEDQFDEEFWQEFQFSVYDPKVVKRILKQFDDAEEGEQHLKMFRRYFDKNLERARRFSWSLTVPVENPKIEYILFGSDCVETAARAVVEEVDDTFELRLLPKEIRNPLPGVDYSSLILEPGDGVVTKASLLARQTHDPTISRHRYSFFPLDYSMFLCVGHSRLTANLDFQNNLLHALLSVDR